MRLLVPIHQSDRIRSINKALPERVCEKNRYIFVVGLMAAYLSPIFGRRSTCDDSSVEFHYHLIIAITGGWKR